MSNSRVRIVIIGGGAAGFFGAVTCAAHNPEAEVILLEKTSKLLSKVRVSGGGRCNVTNNTRHVSQLIKNYPRGGKQLRQPFEVFGVGKTVEWFEHRGVKLKTEPDGRMFPVTDNSQTIIDCLLHEAGKTGVIIKTGTGVEAVEVRNEDSTAEKFLLKLNNGSALSCHKLLIATGGSPKPESYQWLEKLGHKIEAPVPSLFTFNVPAGNYAELMGISVPAARVKVAGKKLEEEGPLLVTHWGFSGPAVLRTSAWGARMLHEAGYKFTAHISWVPNITEDELRQHLTSYREANPKRVVSVNPMFGLPQRLWKKITEIAEINPEIRWADLPKKNQNKLLEELLRSEQTVSGKTTFKEEFVTAGGVSLQEVDMRTMQSRKVPGLYFAGEVLDIDGITGGFNFQAAWATGFVAGQEMAKP